MGVRSYCCYCYEAVCSLGSHTNHLASRVLHQAGRHDILDLKKHMEKQVRVKFSGGREGNTIQQHTCIRQYTAVVARILMHVCTLPAHTVTGQLKAFDPLVNLVLFGAVETLRSTFAHHLPTSPPPFFVKTSPPSLVRQRPRGRHNHDKGSWRHCVPWH